jgi:antitoxin MazE
VVKNGRLDSGRGSLLFRFALTRLPQPYARLSAVFIDELDAGAFEDLALPSPAASSTPPAWSWTGTNYAGFRLAIATYRHIYSVSTSRKSTMIVEFCKWGNSLAVRIPKVLADTIKISDGKRAEIKVENGALVLRPIVKPARKPSYTLDELLSGMTRDNVPQEVDWGIKRGNEAW